MKLTKHLLMLALAGGIAFTGAAEHLKSLNAAGIDKNTPAGEDFYLHVNRGWMEANPLTPEHARYGSFNVLADSSQARIRRIIDGLGAANPEKGTTAYKVAALYKTGMDSIRRNQMGAEPIKADLARIEAATPDQMADLFLWMHKYNSSPLLAAGPMEDMLNSQEYAMYVVGAPLNLGDRDYYLENDKRNKSVRDAYQKLIVNQMVNAGYSKKDAQRISKNVLKIETLIADSTWTREASRNMQAQYNPMTMAELQAAYPSLNWKQFFNTTMGIDPERVIVTTPNTVAQGIKLYDTLTDREKKDLYLWQVVASASPYLSDKFSNTAFEFNKVMSGVQVMQPRWKRVQGAVERSLGEAIGELYVAQYFPESSKIYMQGLVQNLRNALAKHIMHLPWMSDDTKVQALGKLNSITVKIGYPDSWKDYTTLNVDPNLSYWENVHNAQLWENDEQLAKWGKPVDRTEWGMTPQTINAYYNPLNNEIVFPAGILQAPFYDPEASDAENYGGIGVVIGHELTHGFDDQGCNFDKDGNMINWWTAEDKEAFDKLTGGLVEQYSAVEVLPGLHANGQYTLGENIADQGGLRIAMTAFLDSQKQKGVDVNSPAAMIDGFTPAQVFYMNFANLWAQNIREEEIRSLTSGDVHSLGENRVNVALRNIQPFFDAFGIKEGQKLYLPASEQVIIW
ncbi:MAG: M13 family metallopeptidase [Muribaculaceae bacterium]|nr:M13 family metallopeptidase [Bacteroides sp.]MDE7495454.1 M13 family metallopeptidase [Muribaculaceae bacterium]